MENIFDDILPDKPSLATLEQPNIFDDILPDVEPVNIFDDIIPEQPTTEPEFQFGGGTSREAGAVGGWGEDDEDRIGLYEEWIRKPPAIPFDPFPAIKTYQLYKSVKRLEASEYLDENKREADRFRVSKYLKDIAEEQFRGKTFLAKVYDVVSDMPAYMSEFLLTGGLASLGKAGTTKALTKLLGTVAKKQAGRLAIKGIGWGVSGGLRAAQVPHKVAESIIGRRIPEGMQLTEKGKLITEGVKESPFTSAWKGLGDVWIEMMSEEAGAGITKVGRKGLSLIAKKAPFIGKAMRKLGGKWIGMGAGRTMREFNRKIGTATGYHGVLEEMGEERLGDFMRAVVGIQDFGAGEGADIFDRVMASVPKPEQLLVEGVAFSIPGVARVGAGALMRGRTPTTIKEPTEEGVPGTIVKGLEVDDTAPIKPTPTKAPVKPTSAKELEPLAKEAKKHKSVEEFVQSQREAIYPELTIESSPGLHKVIDDRTGKVLYRTTNKKDAISLAEEYVDETTSVYEDKEVKAQLTDIYTKAHAKPVEADKPAEVIKKVKEEAIEEAKPTTKTVTILPDKEKLLTQIKTAIAKAPDIAVTTNTVPFQIDGGADILNTKTALQTFYDKVRKTPAKMTIGEKKKKIVLPPKKGLETFQKMIDAAVTPEEEKLAIKNFEEALKMPEMHAEKEYFTKSFKEEGFRLAKQAKKVDIHPELDTFVHKLKGDWIVSEAKTGLKMSVSTEGATPEKAITNTKQRIKEAGIAKAKENIAKAKEISPRYKKITPVKKPAEVVKELAIKPTYKPTQNLTDIVKAKMKEQKGAITVSGEPIKRAATAITEAKEKIADVFTRYRNIDDVTREEFVALEEMAGKKMEDAANLSMQMIGNKYDKPTRRAIQLYMDNPAKYPVPKGTENTIREIDKLQKLHNQVLKEAGYDITEWPQSKIKYLEEEIPKLEEKLSKYKTDKAKDNVREKIKNTKEEIKKLKKLGYIHRVSRRTVAGAIRKLIREPSKIRRISARPVKFLGRTYNTIAEAEAAGIEVGDITESIAETTYSIWKTAETKALIDAINKNTAYALSASKAPSDWQRIDPRTMPSAKGKRYHPAMAEAIRELTYTSNLSLDRLLKLYDKINVMGKMIGFYNPVFMTNYDLQQGWRAAGIKFLFKIPEAIKIFSEKGDKYSEFMKGGLFNKVIDYKPGVDVMTRQMLDMAEKSYGIRFAEKLGDVLLHPIKGLQIFNNKTTWKMDEILRIACRLGIENQQVTKGLSAFLKTDLANDFMAAYNKFPKATKKTLNRVIFTPTYKISMMRILGKMHANPKQFTAPLIRHHAYKLFLKFVLPTIIGAWLANKYKDKITKAYSEKGYRIVIKIGDKVEKVYAISGPLLEETKITHRKPEYTLKLNLSFGLNFLNTLLNRNKGYTEPNDLKRIGEYFKIGAPGIREYLNWTDKDKTTADKFLTQLGFAYAYTRIPAEPVKDKRASLIKALSAMDLWLDWRESEETRIRLKTERRYRYYSDEIYKAVKRKDREEIRELLKKSRKEFGQTFPLRNVYARIRREKRVKVPKLTREEQQLRARNRFLRTIISRKMRKESD